MKTIDIVMNRINIKIDDWHNFGLNGLEPPCSLREWIGMTVEEYRYFTLGDEYLLPILYSQGNGCSIEDAVALLMDS